MVALPSVPIAKVVAFRILRIRPGTGGEIHNGLELNMCYPQLLEMINAMEVREDDEEFQNPVDIMFENLEKKNPKHFAVRQYKKYKLAAGVINYKRFLIQSYERQPMAA